MYQILGVDQTASQEEIQKAYKKKCLSIHPDKGGDIEEFKKLNTAYQTLCTPSKRREYDGTKHGTNTKRGTHTKRGSAILRNLDVNLPDFYTGRDIPISIICCTTMNIHRSRGVPIQQCPSCVGTGVRSCTGNKYEKILTVRITPGMSIGDQIRIEGEYFDVIVTLTKTVFMEEYLWKGTDLHITRSVDMAMLLLGFQLCMDHPRGKQLTLNWIGGHIHQTMALIAKGLGMPIKGGKYGDLYVHLVLPISKNPYWTTEQRIHLRHIFPTWTVPCEGGLPLMF